MMFRMDDFLACKNAADAAEVANRKLGDLAIFVRQFAQALDTFSKTTDLITLTARYKDFCQKTRSLLGYLDDAGKAPSMEEDRYLFMRDEDSHNYLIPLDKKDAFRESCDQAYDHDNFDEFIEKFGHYRVPYSIYTFSFTNPKPIPT
jgi:hypothetical protein